MKPIYKTMELITINDQLTNIDFNENTSRNTTINNINIPHSMQSHEAELHRYEATYCMCIEIEPHRHTAA